MYPSYIYLRPIVVIAGILGIIQGLTWMAMSITAITAYYCHFDFTNVIASLGSLKELTFFQMYFRGECEQIDLPFVDFSALEDLQLLRPVDIHAFMWVYLMLSAFWVASSVVLITNVTMRFIDYLNTFLYIWIFLTIVLSLLDLVLGCILGSDYGVIIHRAADIPFTAETTLANLVLLTAQSVAGTLMSISFRGYVLWIINVGLAMYFFKETFSIYEYNKMKVLTGMTNIGFTENLHSIHKAKPIDAYAYNPRANYPTTELPPHRSRSQSAHSIYDDRLVRPSSLQPPPPKQNNQLRRSDDDVVVHRNQSAAVARELRRSFSHSNRPTPNGTHIPEPDYSPNMPRAYDNRPPLRSALRNSRYQ